MRSESLSSLMGLNTEHQEATKKSVWYDVLGAGGSGWASLGYALFQTAFGKALGVTPRQITPPSDVVLLDAMHEAFDIRNTVRLLKKGKTYRVFLPLHTSTFRPHEMFVGANNWHTQNGVELGKRIEAAFPRVTDPASPIDVSFELSNLDLSGITNDSLGFPDEGIWDKIQSITKSVRITAPPCARAVAESMPANIIDAWAAGTADPYIARQYLTSALSKRRAIVYIELEIDTNSASFICQGEPKLSLLGEYFARFLESEYMFGQEADVTNVVPISNIVAANKESGLKPVSRTDGNDLTVDGKGEVLWIPNIDNSEFVEAEMELGGMQPNGEWTRQDSIDPDTNDYVTVPNEITGRNTRMRKPRGRNRLIYTDWHNARLSYTDDAGHMELIDLSMNRPATVGQLASILNQYYDTSSGRTTMSSLGFACSRGVELGSKVALDYDLYKDFFSQDEANVMADLLNAGKLSDYVEQATTRLRSIERTGEGGPRRWSPEEVQEFSKIMSDNWLRLDLINDNSPVPFLRAVHSFLAQTYEKAMANQEKIFGKYVVATTLREMAVLVVVVKYAGRYTELHQLDLERRAKYLTPDLTPVSEIEVKDIPFVSGSVELFPHQVKAWNYLKNTPENMVIDVAAGGGKTMLALLEIAYQLGKGMRWPLVICPADLVKNYINDANWLFNGRVNMVVLNGTTFNSPEWGEENLRELVLHAPVNTIFLTDYNFIIPRRGSNRLKTVMYGVELLEISLNTEFLKSFQWGGIWMDESHLTKNQAGSTNQELARLVANIPFKRQLSGTYISDNLTDVVGQFALLNPQTFGDMSDFLDNYFENGSKNSAPLPGAQRRIREAMSEDSVVLTIRRKEWAALLPRRSDDFWAVEMTDAQREVYNMILQDQREEIERRIAEDAAFAAQMKSLSKGEEDEESSANLDVQLAFYLQRLEKFITAPDSDELGRRMLSGADLLSPKLAKVVELLNHHTASKIPGKVLIWTQYVESASSIYESLPPAIRARTVKYTAATADTAMAEFKSNKSKDFMIGCEKSMNTGHNLQFCSRIIRLETVWNWGTLEQGEARINRPALDDPRRHENGGQGIFYDWVFCNKSMDVTKNARMISKLISTVKFYEQNNGNYQDLPALDPIKLTQANIFAVNDWQDADLGCLKYFEVYGQYAALEQNEFDSFLQDPANRIEPYTLEEGEILEGSGILRRVPYIPQMQLFSSEKLGLIPYVEYVSSTYGKGKKLLSEDPNWTAEDLKVHCEFGDCVVRRLNRGGKTLRVVTPSGELATVPVTMCWVITKGTANQEDIRTSIARKVGVDVDAEIVPTKEKVVKQKDGGENSLGRKPADNNAAGFAVFLETYNHQLSLVVNTEDVDAANALPDLLKMGFALVPDYNYTKVANWRVLENWLAKVSTKVQVHPEYLARLEEDIANWKSGKTMEKFAYGLASGKRKTYLFAQRVKLQKGIIKPYLVSHNGTVFLCLNTLVNQSSLTSVKNATSPGIKWKSVTGEHWMFAANKQQAQAVAKELFAKFKIINRKELVNQLAEVRVVKLNAN